MPIGNCIYHFHQKFITRSSVIITIQEAKLCRTNRKVNRAASDIRHETTTAPKRNVSLSFATSLHQ
jgi:hypothetical protein